MFEHEYCYCFYTVKCFQLLLSNISNSIRYSSIVYRQWSGYKYCYSTLFIHLQMIKWFQVLLCNTNNLISHTVKEFQVLLFNTNNFIQHYSFVCTQFNSLKYCYVSLTIQLNICHLFIQFKCQTVLFDS